jgi:hypothetical protein
MNALDLTPPAGSSYYRELTPAQADALAILWTIWEIAGTQPCVDIFWSVEENAVEFARRKGLLTWSESADVAATLRRVQICWLAHVSGAWQRAEKATAAG